MSNDLKLKKYPFVNFPISTGEYQDFISEILNLSFQKTSKIICVANVHMFIEAYKDKSFLDIVQQADIITPDGKPLIWALKAIHNIKQARVAGMDLLPDLLTQMYLNNVSAFFYGGTDEMVDNTKVYIQQNFPKLKVAGFHSPPFGINNDISPEVVAQINNSMPCIVFIILGCPKQEKFMSAVKDRVNTVMIGIGGALPVMIGMKKRAPAWMQNVGLEWFYRLSQEPKRLFKRYFYTNSLFLWIFLKEYINKVFKKRSKF